MESITWYELANLYDRIRGGGRKARTLPMNKVFEWAEGRTDVFIKNPDGTLSLRNNAANEEGE